MKRLKSRRLLDRSITSKRRSGEGDSMASKEMYERVKNLTQEEIIFAARKCCGDDDDDTFCESECPYLDVREEEQNPVRFCRQWVIHDLIKIVQVV